MKKIALIFSVVLVLMLAMSVVPFRSLAADEDTGDLYTIRVFTGEQGTYKGDTVFVSKLAYGDDFSFNINDVDVSGTLDEDGQVKYAALGVHEAGKEDAQASAFKVTGDVDLVVMYGLRSQLVQYTVHYMYGTTELGSDTYYAYDGDKAIAPWRYFEGYVPQYRNITGTVHADDPNGNNWMLPYSLVTVEEATTAAAAVPAANANVPAANPADTAGGGAAPAGGGAVVPGGGAEEPEAPEEPEGPGGEDIDNETAPQGDGPQDVIDIDDETAPQDDGNQGEGEAESETTIVPDGHITTLGVVGIAAGGVVVAGGIVAVIFAAAKSRKKKG